MPFNDLVGFAYFDAGYAKGNPKRHELHLIVIPSSTEMKSFKE